MKLNRKTLITLGIAAVAIYFVMQYLRQQQQVPGQGTGGGGGQQQQQQPPAGT